MLEINKVSDKFGAAIDCSGLVGNYQAFGQRLRDLLDEYQFLVLKDIQFSSLSEYVSFARVFGEPVKTVTKYKTDSEPCVAIVSNAKTEGQPAGIVVPPYIWHADGYIMPKPYCVTMLHAKKVPASGGETLFANTRSVYQELDLETQQQVEHLYAIYKCVIKDVPMVRHALVQRNKNTGIKSLYLNINELMGVSSLSKKDGKQLVAKLYEKITCKENTYKHKWSVNDLVIWDNFSTMHAATEPPLEPRLLYRITFA